MRQDSARTGESVTVSEVKLLLSIFALVLGAVSSGEALTATNEWITVFEAEDRTLLFE